MSGLWRTTEDSIDLYACFPALVCNANDVAIEAKWNRVMMNWSCLTAMNTVQLFKRSLEAHNWFRGQSGTFSINPHTHNKAVSFFAVTWRSLYMKVGGSTVIKCPQITQNIMKYKVQAVPLLYWPYSCIRSEGEAADKRLPCWLSWNEEEEEQACLSRSVSTMTVSGRPLIHRPLVTPSGTS